MLSQKDKEIIDKATDIARDMFFQNKVIEAKGICQQILKCDPADQYAKQLIGLIEHRAGRYRDAIKIFSGLIQEDPTNADNYNNIALSYSCVSDFRTSIVNLEEAIKLRPEASCFYNNLGLQYRNIRDYTNAVHYFSKAAEMNSEDKLSWSNLGSCYGEMREFDLSNFAFQKALEIDPDYAVAHVDYAYNLQYQGKWKDAWEHYEYRFKQFAQLQFYKNVYSPDKKWDGKASLEGKRYIAYCEQGLGDAISFARYLKYLKQRGAYVIVHCYDTVEPIMKLVDGVDEITLAQIHKSQPEEVPAHDFHSSIMSLPLLLHMYLPFYEKYLTFSKKADLRLYKNKFKIGIIWAGSPLHPEDSQRSCYLKEFKVLCDIPDVKLFSLQKDCRARKYQHVEEPIDLTEGADDLCIVDAAEYIGDFEDVAMFLNSLDLLVSVDTAPIHLAGAMEKPVFMAVAYNSDPRWGVDQETTPWYPTMRIFRQKERGNWKEVFERIANEVKIILQNKRQKFRKT